MLLLTTPALAHTSGLAPAEIGAVGGMKENSAEAKGPERRDMMCVMSEDASGAGGFNRSHERTTLLVHVLARDACLPAVILAWMP